MNKDISVDILKFLAVLLITNSHFGGLYPDSISVLATGGAIGDALFFFCSGFTLLLKPMGRFDNWYKKRISRIYPTIFAWAIILYFIFGVDYKTSYVIMDSGGWFVNCILIYYIVIYFVDRYVSKHLYWFLTFYSVAIVVTYIFWEKGEGFRMYEQTYIKWVFFFLFMLLGAIIGRNRIAISAGKSLAGLVVCLVLFYALFFLSIVDIRLNHIQLLSLVPLAGVVLFLYTLCNSEKIKSLIRIKYLGWTIMFIGGMCLEIYITQMFFIRMEFSMPFPLNCLVVIAMIIVTSYFLRCMSRLFLQTFNKQDYNWKEIFKMV